MSYSTQILRNIINPTDQLKEEFLLETRGEDTAHSGFANEHFTQQHLAEYVKHVQGGGSHESGLEKITRAKFSPGKIKSDHPIQRAMTAIGSDEVGKIHDDSKDTAAKIVNHLRNNYNLGVTGSHHVGKVGPAGAEEVRKLTGKPSNADLVVETENPKKKKGFALAHLEHIGASLKYSKGAGGDVKIHAPSISNMADIIDNHHEQMHGERMGIADNMKSAVRKGLKAQQDIVATHAEDLIKHLSGRKFKEELKDPKKAKKYSKLLKPATLEKIRNGQLPSAGVSYIRNSDKFRHVYDKMGKANLAMKTQIAAHLHKGIAAVLNSNLSSKKHKEIKESLVRSIANVQRPEQSDSLPTFLVSTERGKPTQIYDVHSHFQKHFDEKGLDQHSYTKGSSTMRVGPTTLAVDARPATSGNPLGNPANVTVSSSALKKGNDVKGLKEEVSKASIAAQIFEAQQKSQSISRAIEKNQEIYRKMAASDANNRAIERNIEMNSAEIASKAIRRSAETPDNIDTRWVDNSGQVRGLQGGARVAGMMTRQANLGNKDMLGDTGARLNDVDVALLQKAAMRINQKMKGENQNDETEEEVNEEAPANSMGAAGISGLSSAVDVGIAGRDMLLAPGPLRRLPPKMFGGKRVFTVPSSDYYKATLGRKKGQHWRSMVAGPLGEEIRQYALDNKDAPIIVEDETTGAMMYLRYGKR